MHEITRFLGLNNANGASYLFWSGFGGDLLTALPLTWAVYLWYKHNKCKRCFRLGKHVPSYHWPYCKRHTPTFSHDLVAKPQAL